MQKAKVPVVTDNLSACHCAGLTLQFGALAPKLVEQLKMQGLDNCKPLHLDSWQSCADAITLLVIHGLITELEGRKARLQLINNITKDVWMR